MTAAARWTPAMADDDHAEAVAAMVDDGGLTPEEAEEAQRSSEVIRFERRAERFANPTDKQAYIVRFRAYASRHAAAPILEDGSTLVNAESIAAAREAATEAARRTLGASTHVRILSVSTAADLPDYLDDDWTDEERADLRLTDEEYWRKHGHAND